jgi:hypothetical protein
VFALALGVVLRVVPGFAAPMFTSSLKPRSPLGPSGSKTFSIQVRLHNAGGSCRASCTVEAV